MTDDVSVSRATTDTKLEHALTLIAANEKAFHQQFSASEKSIAQSHDSDQRAIKLAFDSQKTAMETAFNSQASAVAAALAAAKGSRSRCPGCC